MKNRIKYFITSIVAFILSSPVYAKGTYVTCGSIKNLPYKVLQLSNTVVNIMQIAVPIILIIMGSIDFVKAISSQKEDALKALREWGRKTAARRYGGWDEELLRVEIEEYYGESCVC